MASSTVQPIIPPSTTTTTTTTPLTTATSNPQQNQNQIPVVPNLPPQSQPTLSSSISNNFNSKKRPLDHVYLLQSSPYFKMRAFIRDLRPLFLQVLRAPEFQNCEAAHKIQEKMKLMVELCRHQNGEKVPLVKCNSGPVTLDFTNEKRGGNAQKPAEQPAQEKRFPVGNNVEKPMQGSTRIAGTYIVGGSAFGWNFITFHGTKPEYYGRTKESFRAGK